jgi:hypothetical protein
LPDDFVNEALFEQSGKALGGFHVRSWLGAEDGLAVSFSPELPMGFSACFWRRFSSCLLFFARSL